MPRAACLLEAILSSSSRVDFSSHSPWRTQSRDGVRSMSPAEIDTTQSGIFNAIEEANTGNDGIKT